MCEHGWCTPADCDACTSARVAPQAAARIAELEAGIREYATKTCHHCRAGSPLVDDGIYRDTLWHSYGGELVACKAALVQIATKCFTAKAA